MSKLTIFVKMVGVDMKIVEDFSKIADKTGVTYNIMRFKLDGNYLTSVKI